MNQGWKKHSHLIHTKTGGEGDVSHIPRLNSIMRNSVAPSKTSEAQVLVGSEGRVAGAHIGALQAFCSPFPAHVG